jgi:hypothetical protein
MRGIRVPLGACKGNRLRFPPARRRGYHAGQGRSEQSPSANPHGLLGPEKAIISPAGELTRETTKGNHHMKIFFAAVVAASGLLLAAAPAANDADVKVTGTVTINGKPLSAAKVAFHLDDEFVGAKTKVDGKYTVNRLAPGTFKVTIEGKHVPEKFASDDKTPLVAEIKAGKNVLDFALSE